MLEESWHIHLTVFDNFGFERSGTVSYLSPICSLQVDGDFFHMVQAGIMLKKSGILHTHIPYATYFVPIFPKESVIYQLQTLKRMSFGISIWQ